MKMRTAGRRAAVGMVTLLLTTLSACAASGADGGGGSTADKAAVDRYQKNLDHWYKGTYQEPDGPAVKAPKAKDIWLISSGLGNEYSERVGAGAKAAAKALGWSVHIFDSKFDPTQMLTGVQQAVVAHASGIIIQTVDCPTVKNAVQQARQARIPIIGIETADCSPSLYTHVVTYAGKMSSPDWAADFGRAQAAWVIAKTHGQAKVVVNTETDSATTLASTKGVRDELRDCSTCKVVDDATFVAADFGPPLQAKIQQTMVKNPDANSFIPNYDAVMTQSGGASALQSAGRLNQLAVGGGEGSSAGIAQIRSGDGMQMCAGQSPEWESFSAIDALVRVFLDRNPDEVDTGNGIQVCDKDHNLPPKGEAYQPPVDFAAAYKKLWGLG